MNLEFSEFVNVNEEVIVMDYSDANIIEIISLSA